METTYSAVGCSSPSKDDDTPPPSVPLGVDALDRDQDDVCTHRVMGYDELREILSWMPAKSAIKYSSSLCKWLHNIHSESGFIQKQCIRSCGQDNGFFLQSKLEWLGYGRSKKKEFHVLPWVTGSAFGIPHESLDYLANYGRILSSSNGLLLLGDMARSSYCCYEFRVCNPAMRKWAPLPTPKGFTFLVNEKWSPLIECYPWGLDNVEFPNDYTIALPVEPENTWQLVDGEWKDIRKQQLLIYSNGRWEEELCDVSIEGRICRYDMPVAFFSDATKGLVVHYLCDSDKPGRDGLPEYGPGKRVYMEPYIAAFDIREKKLVRQIKLPELEGVWTEHNLHRWGGTHKKLWISKWKETSIILVRWYKHCGSIAAWVLDNYGCEKESWRLVMRELERELWSDYEWDWTMSVGVASGRGLLFQTEPAFPTISDDDDDEMLSVPIGKESRLFLYVVEGEGQGRLELVGDHHFDLSCATFMPYSNTLRPVSVQNAETRSY